MAEKAGLHAKTQESKQKCSNSCKQKPSYISSGSPAERILQLQRTAGNQAVQKLIKSRALQAKLKIGPPNDIYEQEADRIAEHVMRMPNPVLQQKCDKCNSNRDEKLQAKELSGKISEVTPHIEVDIRSMRGGGQPLTESERAFFEPRFGVDFGQVRVHTNVQAGEFAQGINARAYAVGQDIVFGARQYAPGTSEGRRLIAHELTHVIQQRQGEDLKIRMSRLLDFKDKDELHDPSKLTDTQIEATDEFKRYMNPALIWQSKDKVTREEALLACRLILRHLREGRAIVWSSDARVFMELARSQLGTLKKAEGEVGKLKWVPFRTQVAVADPSKLESDFGKWILAGGPEPDAGTGKVNCWEMVLFSAYKGGFTSKARIEGIYKEGVKQAKAGARSSVGDTIEVELRRGNEYVFDPKNPKSPEPLPGDIVIFSTAATHAAISHGTKDGSGRHKIISHWPPPDGSYKTKETTIEELLIDPNMKPGTVIKFWSPKW